MRGEKYIMCLVCEIITGPRLTRAKVNDGFVPSNKLEMRDGEEQSNKKGYFDYLIWT